MRPCLFAHPTLLAVVVFGMLGWAPDDRAADYGNADSSGFKLTQKDQSTARKLVRAAEDSGLAIQRLAQLCDTFGPRFSGTTNLEAAIDWVLEQMKADGLEHVHGEEVMVPRWVRGAESAEILQPVHRTLPM